MQTILKSEETETQRTAILTDEYYEGTPVFKLEVKTEKTYFLPKDWFDEEVTLNCLLDMINELKEKGFKIIDTINK